MYFDDKEIKKQKFIFKLKLYGILIVFLFLLLGAGYLITYSHFFQINGIALIDAENKQANANEIIKDLKDSFNKKSKLTSFLGANNILIWQNNPDETFFKEHPKIIDLTIKKDYLNRKIEINMYERGKLGVWCLHTQINADTKRESTFCGWFDEDGIIFEEAPLVEGEIIYKIIDSSNRELMLGDRVLDENLFNNLILIFKTLEKSGLNLKTLRLENLSAQEIVVESPSMPKIYFSLRFDPDFSLSVFENLKKTNLEKVEYIDLRIKNRAYYKLK